MLCVILENDSEFIHHIGGEKPSIDINLVEEIQADGHELNVILSKFSNVPYHNTSPVQSWFGDMAKFIFSNL